MDINLTKSAQEITLKGAFVTHTRTPHICVTLYIRIYVYICFIVQKHFITCFTKKLFVNSFSW